MMFPANYDFDGRETIELDGFTLCARLEHDDCHGAPWDEEDGHGPVSDWRKRDYAGRFNKAPGELLLFDYGGRARFYDLQRAQELALADGWDAQPYNVDGRETRRQQAAKAARADFERLRAYCDNQWSYVGVIVTASRNGIELSSVSLFGIESDAGAYLVETADELAEEALADAKATLATLCDCAEAA